MCLKEGKASMINKKVILLLFSIIILVQIQNYASANLFPSYLFKLSIDGFSGIRLFYNPPESLIPEIPSSIIKNIYGSGWALNFTQNSSKNPKQLFDIQLILEKTSLTPEDNLGISIKFENFGSIPTAVNLTYRILNDKQEIVYEENDSILVQTERILVKTFDNLVLDKGNYNFVLTTVYGENVTDEFRQTFEVKPLSLSGSFYNFLNKNLILISAFFLLIVFLLIYLIYFKKKK